MLGKKLNCNSCVPACTRANLFGLKLRLYRYGFNAGAAVGSPHSHRSEGRPVTQSYVFEVRP